MADFPNAMTEVTDTDGLKNHQRQTLGGDDIQSYLLDDTDLLLRAIVHMFFPDPVTFGTTAVALAEANPVGALYTLSMSDAANAYHGTQKGNLITLDRQAGAWLDFVSAQYGLYDCPYPRAGGTTYYVGCEKVVYPAAAAVATGGSNRFKTWTRAMGFSTVPDTVTPGVGTLTFDVTTAVGGAWASDATYGRNVVIWLNNPATAGSSSLFTGVAKSDGVNVTVTVSHQFGQGTPSTTASDYTVVVPGLRITTTNLVAAGYWVLATVLNGAITSAQTLGSLPGTMNLDLQQLAQDLYYDPAWSLDGDGNPNGAGDPAGTEPVQQLALRLMQRLDTMMTAPQHPGCWLGGVNGAAGGTGANDWCDPANVTTVDAGVTTFTFTNPAGAPLTLADWWIRTAGGKVGAYFSSLVATHNQADPLDTYIVYVDATEVETVGGPNRVELSLAITTDADWAATKQGTYLPVYTFDWDPAQAPGARVTNEDGASLIHYSGALDQTWTFPFSDWESQVMRAAGDAPRGFIGSSMRLHPAAANEFEAKLPHFLLRAIKEGATQTRVTLHDQPAGGAAPANSNARWALWKSAAGTAMRMALFGPSGLGALGNAEVAQAGLGGEDTDLAIKVTGRATSQEPTVEMLTGAAGATILAQWARTTGQQTNPTNGTERARIGVPDVALIGSDGKLASVGLDLQVGAFRVEDTGGSAEWDFDNGINYSVGAETLANAEFIWKTITNALERQTPLFIRIPHGGLPGRGPAGVGGGGTGSSCKLVKVHLKAAVEGTGGTPADDQLKARIVEFDPAANTWTAKSGEVTWDGSEGTVSKDIDENASGGSDPDGEPDGIEMSWDKQYFVECWAAVGAAPSLLTRRVYAGRATYRVFEMGAGCP